MHYIKSYFKEELTGWKPWEVMWLSFTCIWICGLSIFWGDSVLGIITATTGIACVVFTGKGKPGAHVFGAINAILYSIISFRAKYFGECMLNALAFPIECYGFFAWSKNMNYETHEVKKRRMKPQSRFTLAFVTIICIVAYGFVLFLIGGSLPFIDSVATVISIVAMIISAKMYMEQWYLWIIVNAVTLVMWIIAFIRDKESISTLLMWSVYLVNSIIMFYKWKKETNSIVEL